MASNLNRWFAGRFTAIATVSLLLVSAAFAQHYTRTDLTTNSSSVSGAPNIDPNLINPWGLSRATSSPWWISDNGTGLSTLYDLNGVPQSLVVTIPPRKMPRDHQLPPERSLTTPPASMWRRVSPPPSFSSPRTVRFPAGIPRSMSAKRSSW